MFQFVCEKLIPGCTHTDEDEDREELLERATQHFKEHHDYDLEHHHEPIADTLNRTGVVFLRPV
jgi:predicted small metal-binding protein